VPVASTNLQTPNAGVAVQWNTSQANQLFGDLRRDDTEAVRQLAAAQRQAAGG
jgi:hypothetical protein